VACRQQYEPLAPAHEEHVPLHEEPADPLLDDGRKSRVDPVIRAGGQHAGKVASDI
jgi:hypothetical protein